MRLSLDSGYLAMVALFGAFGVVGVTATANIQPNVISSLTCNCLPTTLVRFQELAISLLGVAIALVPVGIWRSSGETMATHLDEKYQGVLPSGHSYTGFVMRDGAQLAVGVALVVFGIGIVASSYLDLKNTALIGEGAAMIVVGIVLTLRGGRSP